MEDALRYLGYSALLHGLLLAALLVWAPAVVEHAAPGIVRVLLLADEEPAGGGDVSDARAGRKRAPEREPPAADAPAELEPVPAEKVRLVTERPAPAASPAAGSADTPAANAAPVRVARHKGVGLAPGPPRGGIGAERDRRIALIQARIQEALFYPRAARRRGIEGTVHVRFGIGQDGRVDGLAVAQSSGHRLLDRASVKTVERAQPFPRIEGALEVPVIFRLTGVR